MRRAGGAILLPGNPVLGGIEMNKSTILSAVAAACLLGLTATAFAAVKGEFNDMCTMGLALGKQVKTDSSINEKIDGKTYCFGNA
jgi:hypothetical protein